MNNSDSDNGFKALLEKALPEYLIRCRWFGGKSKNIIDIKITEDFVINKDTLSVRLLFISVRYSEGQPENYFLPLMYSSGEAATKIIEGFPNAVICKMRVEKLVHLVSAEEGILYDAVYDKLFRMYLYNMIFKHSRLKGLKGTITSQTGKYLKSLKPQIDPMKSTL